MLYVGNDLVAFSGLNSFNRPGYKQKAFTLREITNAAAYQDASVYFGTLWSCKESAYKVHLKMGARKAFAAGKYEVNLSQSNRGALSGTIQYEDATFYSTSMIVKEEYIHTICSNLPEGLDIATNKVKQISFSDYDHQNISAIELLKTHLCGSFKINPSEIDVHFDHLKKHPVIFFNSGNNHLDISLSHDGHYTAFALIVSENSNIQN